MKVGVLIYWNYVKSVKDAELTSIIPGAGGHDPYEAKSKRRVLTTSDTTYS